MSEFSNWWNPLLTLRPEIKKDDKGAWHFVLRHGNEVETVSNVRGFPTEEDAREAVKQLARGFHISWPRAATAGTPKE